LPEAIIRFIDIKVKQIWILLFHWESKDEYLSVFKRSQEYGIDYDSLSLDLIGEV